MKLNAAYGLLVVAACRPAAGPPPEPARCMAGVPPSAQHPIATRSVALAGDYELIQVQTQPVGAVRSGRLHLAQLDSAARVSATGGPVPDLVGWLEPAGGATPRPGDNLGSTGHTAAVLAGEHLRVGDIGALDGYVEDLTITAVAPEGFWGWWRAFPGWEVTVDSATRRVLPDPAGYFCALRRDSAR